MAEMATTADKMSDKPTIPKSKSTLAETKGRMLELCLVRHCWMLLTLRKYVEVFQP